MLSVRLPPGIDRRLERLAKKTGRSKSSIAREAILRHLENIEDGYIAGVRLKANKAGRVSLEQLHADTDDPFAVFSEWAGEEDDRAYAGL